MFTTDHHHNSSQLYTSPSFQRPKPEVRSSSTRVPISKTAAYSWLQVQKIMESSGHQPKSDSPENEPAATHEQPSMMAHLMTRNNNNLSASSSSSSLNSSVSSDSFPADSNGNTNTNEKRVSADPASSSSSNTVA